MYLLKVLNTLFDFGGIRKRSYTLLPFIYSAKAEPKYIVKLSISALQINGLECFGVNFITIILGCANQRFHSDRAIQRQLRSAVCERINR